MVEAVGGGDSVSHPTRGAVMQPWGRREWAFSGASELQDLTVKGILMSKWAWRPGVSVMLWISRYLCSMGAMNGRPSDHLCLG